MDAGGEHDEDGGGDGAHHDGAAPALERVEREHGQLPQRRPEEQRRRHAGLRRQQREQQLDHGGSRKGDAVAGTARGAGSRRRCLGRVVWFWNLERRRGEECRWIERVVKDAVM